MRYKYFLFDWDGSLADSLPIWFEAFHQVFAEFDMVVSYETIGEKVVGDWDGPKRLGIKNPDEFFRRMEEILTPKFPEVKLNLGAKELLDKIKQTGGKVAVVTTSKRTYVEPAMVNTGVRSLIDVILAKEDVQKFKPDPEQLLKALSRIGGSANQALMTGDTRHDVAAAKNGDVDSALYYPDSYSKYYKEPIQESLGATYMVKNFKELERFLA